MDKLNKNFELNVTLIKHHIKDLSFEIPQSIIDNNAKNNDNVISESINFIYKPFENNFFSIIFKYSCECSIKTNGKKIFLLELDYFGFFKILDNKCNNQAELTKKGVQLIFPFVKSIVEDLSAKGGSLPISLRNLDFDLIKA